MKKYRKKSNSLKKYFISDFILPNINIFYRKNKKRFYSYNIKFFSEFYYFYIKSFSFIIYYNFKD